MKKVILNTALSLLAVATPNFALAYTHPACLGDDWASKPSCCFHEDSCFGYEAWSGRFRKNINSRPNFLWVCGDTLIKQGIDAAQARILCTDLFINIVEP